MSKVAMPEPVAAQSKFTDSNCWAACAVEHHQMVQATPSEWHGYETRTLITTDQAEAYAAARVREALEEVAALARSKYEDAMERRSQIHDDTDAAWVVDLLSQALTYSHMERAIRDLIPPQ